MPSPVRVVFNEGEFRRLQNSPGVIRLIRQYATDVRRRARADAPVSKTGNHGRPAGYLRSRIVIRERSTVDGPSARITTEARDEDGFPYGVYHQRRRPYIRPPVNLSKR